MFATRSISRTLTCVILLFLAIITNAQPGAGDNRPGTNSTLKGDVVYTKIDEMPAPGYDLGTFLSEHLHYPDTARKKGIEGRVIVRFIVSKTGSIDSVTALRGIGYGCDEEAVRVISLMPPWKPGKNEGKAVSVYYTQPIRFQLTD